MNSRKGFVWARRILYAQNDIYSYSLSVWNTENVALVSLVVRTLIVVGKMDSGLGVTE